MTLYERHEVTRTDGSTEVTERRSHVPAIASVSSALMFGAVAFWSVSISGGGSLAGGSPLITVDTGVPNAPNITVVTAVVDSVTFRVNGGPFSGSQGDSHDSTRVLVDSAGGDFTSPLVDSITGPQIEDTISFAAQANAVYDYVMLYRGEVGGWSDTSSVFQHTVSFAPGTIKTLSVVDQADDSLKIQWVTVHNGKGQIAFHGRRYKNITGDTASFVWGGAQESLTEVFDSLGTNIGDTVSTWITGLTPGDTYELGIIAYRDDEGDGDPTTGQGFVYGPVPNAQTTAEGTTTGTPPSSDPETPSLTLLATSDTNSIQMNGSGFNGTAPHDSSRWILSDNSDLTSAFYDVWSSLDLTSHLATDNANLDAGATVYGGVVYAGSAGLSDTSAIKSIVNSAPSEGHPNEPSGMTALTDNPMSSLTHPGWNNFKPGNCSIQQDLSAPVSPSDVLRHRMPEGGSAGSTYCAIGFNFSDQTTVYIHYQVRFEPDSLIVHPGSEVLKLGFLKSDNTNHFWGVQGSGLRLFYQLQDQFAPTQVLSQPFRKMVSGSGGNMSREAWHDLEMCVVAGDSDDGILKFWVDGTLVLDLDDIDFVRESGDGWGWATTEIIWGGTGGSLPHEQFVKVDHYYISAKSAATCS